MNELIKVNYDDESPKVSGRDLHEACGVDTPYHKWFPRMCEYGFTENTDFWTILSESTGGRPSTDHWLTVATAKEIAMLQRNEKGKQVRQYLIAVEEKYKQQMIDLSQLSPELQMFKHIFDTVARTQIEQAEIQKQLSLTAEKVGAVEDTLSLVKDTLIQRDDDWRKWLNNSFNNAVMASGTRDFQEFRKQTYDILEQRAHCDLSRRLRNLHDRLAAQGATKARIREANKLDVIENDPRLKEIYTSIVKEFVIRYSS